MQKDNTKAKEIHPLIQAVIQLLQAHRTAFGKNGPTGERWDWYLGNCSALLGIR